MDITRTLFMCKWWCPRIIKSCVEISRLVHMFSLKSYFFNCYIKIKIIKNSFLFFINLELRWAKRILKLHAWKKHRFTQTDKEGGNIWNWNYFRNLGPGSSPAICLVLVLVIVHVCRCGHWGHGTERQLW